MKVILPQSEVDFTRREWIRNIHKEDIMRSHNPHHPMMRPARHSSSHARGFAAMDPEEHRRVSSLGGQHSHSGSHRSYQNSRVQQQGPRYEASRQDRWPEERGEPRRSSSPDISSSMGIARSRQGSNFRDQDYIDRRFSTRSSARHNQDVDFNSRFDDRDEQVYSNSPERYGYDRFLIDNQVDTSSNLRGQYNYGRDNGPEEDYDNPYTARDYSLNEDDTDWRTDQYDPQESRFAESYQDLQGRRAQGRYQSGNQEGSYRGTDPEIEHTRARMRNQETSRRSDRDNYDDEEDSSFARRNRRRY